MGEEVDPARLYQVKGELDASGVYLSEEVTRFNPEDKFELVFKHLLEKLFIERMDQNEDIFVRFMNDVPFQRVVTGWMASEAYRRFLKAPESLQQPVTD